MAIVKSIRALFPGRGVATTYVKREAVAAAVGAVAIAIPAAPASFQPTISNGRIRIRTNTMAGASTLIINKITGTDGTTTVELYAGDAAATAAATGLEREIPFCTNLDLTSITVNLTVGVADETVDVEVAGNQ